MEISRLFWFIFPALCFSLFTLIPKTQADPNFRWVDCRIQTASNVSRLSTLPPNMSISYNNLTSPPSSSPAGRTRSKNLVLCRGDVSAAVCEGCVAFAFGDVRDRCPRSTRVTIWYDECMLRYSDQPIPSVLDQSYGKILISPDNVTDTNGFNHVLGESYASHIGAQSYMGSLMWPNMIPPQQYVQPSMVPPGGIPLFPASFHPGLCPNQFTSNFPILQHNMSNVHSGTFGIGGQASYVDMLTAEGCDEDK